MDFDDRPNTETWTQYTNAESTSTNLEEMASFFPTKKFQQSVSFRFRSEDYLHFLKTAKR